MELRKDNRELKEQIAELASDRSTRSYATTVRSGTTTKKSVSWSDLSPTSIASQATWASSSRENMSNITLDLSHVKEAVNINEVGNTRKKLELLFQSMETLKDVGIKNVRTWPHGDYLGIMKFEVPSDLEPRVRNMADQWVEALQPGVRL